jgi:hypothetical protein
MRKTRTKADVEAHRLRVSPSSDAAFRQTLLSAVDDTFNGTLGGTAASALFSAIENTYSLKRERIPDRLDDFASALRAHTGMLSAVLERNIIKNLYSKLGLPLGRDDEFGFERYVMKAKLREISQIVTTEVDSNPRCLFSADLLERLGEFLNVRSKELAESRKMIGSVLEDYSKEKVGEPLEENTKKFLTNELVYLLLKAKLGRAA